MKINEIASNQLNEGPLDFAKRVGAGVKGFVQGGGTGAKAGWTAQGAANAQTKKINNVANSALQRLSQYSATLSASGKQLDPQTASQWFASFSGSAPETAPQDVSPTALTAWLRKEVGAYMAKKAGGQSVKPAQPAQAKQPTDTPAQTKQPATSTPAGVQIVSPEPLVLKYRNNEFARGDSGQWVYFGSKKPVTPEVAAFLDNQEDILHPATPSNTTGSAKSSTAALTADDAEPTEVGRITTPKGIEVVKWSDGIWTVPSTKEQIVIPNDLKRLEDLLKLQTVSGGKAHTGGRQKGGLSQTPNAIRKRQNRATKKQA